MPTSAQLRSLYIQCYTLTNVMFQPIHIIRLDERTGNLSFWVGRKKQSSLRLICKGGWSMTNKFDSMTDVELRQYFLKHRDDESFHAYMDRRYARPRKAILSLEELEGLPFDEQVKIVESRMRSHFKELQ